MRRINAWPGIAHGYEDTIGLVLLGADQQISHTSLDQAHCFHRAQDQIQDDLLQLNTISLNGNQRVRKGGLDRHSIFGDCCSRQYNHLVDRFIQIKAMLSRRRFLDVVTDPVDEVSGSIGVAHDTDERPSDVAHVRRLLV
jgi:hypothetical protein